MARMPRGASWSRKVVAVLERRLGERKKSKRFNPLEKLIMGILSQRAGRERAERAFRRLKRSFVDLNEVRVSTLGEIEEAIREADPSGNKAPVLRRALTEVFKCSHSADLDFFKEMRPREAGKFLDSIEGLDPKTKSDLMLAVKDEYLLPADVDLLRVCRRIGLVSKDASDEVAYRQLEGTVPKNLAYAFTQLLVEHGQKHCRENKYICAGCPVRRLCTTYLHEKGKARRRGARVRRRRSGTQG